MRIVPFPPGGGLWWRGYDPHGFRYPPAFDVTAG